MSEGANREELDRYARPTPPPPHPSPEDILSITTCEGFRAEYIIFMLYVFHCLQTFLLFSDTLN